MMKTVEQDQNAGPAQQSLPSGLGVRGNFGGGLIETSGSGRGARIIQDDPLVLGSHAIDLTAALQSGDAFAGRELTLANPALAKSDQRIERLGYLILKETSVIRQTGAESLAVVLKPDPQTEVFLQLNHRGGQIEAVVRFDRGDLADLKSNWPQLHETLARLDVQLKPIQPASSSPNRGDESLSSSSLSPDLSASPGGQDAPSQHRNSRPLDSSDEWSGDSGSSARSKSQSSLPIQRRLTGWESWA